MWWLIASFVIGVLIGFVLCSLLQMRATNSVIRRHFGW